MLCESRLIGRCRASGRISRQAGKPGAGGLVASGLVASGLMASGLMVAGWVGAIGEAVAADPPVGTRLLAEAASPLRPPLPKPYAVAGFRSARFGMMEPAVRQAIIDDFGLAGDRVGRVDSPTERTRSLVIVVEDLLPYTGTAAVAYILGHRSRALIQVNIQWGGDLREESDDRLLRRIGLALQRHLLQRGYRDDSIIANRMRADGSAITVFAGRDRLDRLTTLILANPTPAGPTDDADGSGGAAPRPPVKPILTLSYRLDPNNPDIYRIDASKF